MLITSTSDRKIIKGAGPDGFCDDGGNLASVGAAIGGMEEEQGAARSAGLVSPQ
jgi:hypothetical protein